jgi:hypothetical protein
MTDCSRVAVERDACGFDNIMQSCRMMNMIRETSGMSVIKTVGQSGQISLGKQYAGRHALVDEIEPGVWIIKLGEFVPDNERWLLQAGIREEIDQAIAWAERNPPQASDLDELAAKIEE